MMLLDSSSLRTTETRSQLFKVCVCDRALILLLLDFVVQISSMKRYCDASKDGFRWFLASRVRLTLVHRLIFPKTEMTLSEQMLVAEELLQLVTF